MEIIDKTLGGGISNKSSPLISFNAIIDIDLSLISHVIKNYRNDKVFNLNIDRTLHELVGDIYRRKYKNPLYYLMKDEKYKDFLDECYIEFLRDKEKDILSNAISTEIYNLVKDFDQSTDIVPTILFYSKAQEELLANDDKLSNIERISIEKINSNESIKDSYTQYYFKYIDEAIENNFITLSNKTFYFSTTALNLNEDNTDIRDDEEIIIDMIKNKNRINLFDMYRTDIIGSYK